MKNIKQKLGFTLVELMIVVAILGALTVAGVPAFKAFSETSDSRLCGSNVKNIRAAMQEAADNDDTFVKNAYVTSANGDLANYLVDIDELHCPTDGSLYLIDENGSVYCPATHRDNKLKPVKIIISGGSVGSVIGPNDGNGGNGDGDDSNAGSGVCQHTYLVTSTTTATCTEYGIETLICTKCGTIKKTQVEAPWHKYDEVVVVKEVTCGYDGEETQTCTVCGYVATTIIPATGKHTWVTDLYPDGSIGCSVCKHRQEGGYSVTAEVLPTCTEPGSRTYTCNWDGCNPRHTYTIDLPPAHTIASSVVIVEATCEKSGQEKQTCSVCDAIIINIIPATGHNFVDGTCSVCGATDGSGGSGDSGDSGDCEHSYTSEVTAPTCTQAGKATYTCSKCPDSYTEDAPALGHYYSTVQSITYPYYLRTTAITKTGSITLKCSRCDVTTTQTIASSSDYCTNKTHSGGNVTSTTTAATCTTDGSIVYKCSKCTFTHTITLPATGHNFVDGVCANGCGE